jgi:hypothetical protein
MPVLIDTTYGTVGDLREALSIPSSITAPNAMLQRYMNAGATLLDHKTRKPLEGYEAFSESASEVRYFDDILSEGGYIPIHDAVSVTAITRDGTPLDSTHWKLWPYNRGNGPATQIYFNWSASFPIDLFTGGGYYNFPFIGVGLGTVAVTGTWGYCAATTRPREIREALVLQAAAMYRKVHTPTDKVAQALRDPFKYLTAEVELLIARFVKDDGVGFS